MYAASDPKRRKSLLLVSLIINLGMLGVFKYFNFFAGSLVSLLTPLGLQPGWPLLNIVLPVGISFYTFQTLSYTIDIYRRKLAPTDKLEDFALFVSFFPQLVAGPIERASHFLPQLMSSRRLTFEQMSRGSFLILLGLFKKVAIADGLAQSVNAIYNVSAAGTVGTLDIILATYLFAIQVYCDFSGYSDIARGLAKLLGFDLMVNFDTPYFAVNPSDFWRRWHISLSTWLRDYLYIPLGGNRKDERTTYRNLILTMALGGLWHGAAWNFVYWGLYQGGILCVHRWVAGAKPSIRPAVTLTDKIRRACMIVGFFQITCYGWLLFRASSWSQIVAFSDRLFFHPTWSTPTIPTPSLAALAGIVLVLVVDLAHYLSGTSVFYRIWPIYRRAALYAALLVVLLMGLSNTGNTFIYFQF
ncbi:MAG: putative membrane protein involved in D-alanine export [Phormidesmis priestleyi Ana]|uniref:Putative membrane protein involved in D-alanine export n=1 Tax=Phormidesmis priestleyi Ana TaxID=1666911 RepID=A0A0P8BTG3_9CYAN|nr:MAG: putative membrane protein involved in D-alanine export [Phormidesmis priestleyi Ana]